MQVFITGGAGFIGSEFARSALNGSLKEFNIEPTELIVYDSLTYAGNMQNLDILQNNNNFRFIYGNICDQNLNQHVPYECDLVINFAAESHVDRSLSNASIFIETNVLGTQNVLEVVKEKKLKNLFKFRQMRFMVRLQMAHGMKIFHFLQTHLMLRLKRPQI